ncbi:STAS domain-containing protein [Streptomyces antimicrobicus]|uniref:STAS domain-containing protein n=1 Tax=Streptomyces antimicrobicus TaxID=2883108 RepID=A0ABS8B8R3_9ACTN|nr:STAS domain-containing protein [Streptomyces antimicrobicus]MCB5180953.1 STAS domain-containing protein [Streptomyces antimicrobicus]
MDETTVTLPLPGPAIAPAQVPLLCRRLERLYASGAVGAVVCDATALTAPDLTSLDALTRLTLLSRRHGSSLPIHGAGPALRALLTLTGLDEVLVLG